MLIDAEIYLAVSPPGTIVDIDEVHVWKNHDGRVKAHDLHTGTTVTGGGVEDVMTKLAKVEDATLTVANNGRAYRIGQTRITLHVWNKDVEKLKVVKEVFGGNYYTHGSGLLWICAKRDVLRDIWTQVKDYDTGDRLRELEEWYDESSS